MSLHTHYLELGFGLVHLPTGSKAPQGNGWQHHPVKTLEGVARAWQHGGNIGLHHGASRTAVLDIDHPEWAALALAAMDIDLDALLSAPGPKIRGAKGVKPVYLLPEGLELNRKSLAWDNPAGGKRITVFELRAGMAQDVLPPSIHPDTNKPYEWVDGIPTKRDDFPELPGGLRALWENWSVIKPVLDKARPGATPPPARTYKDIPEGGGVIGAFNKAHRPTAIIAARGYKEKAPGRWLSPHSSTGTPGIIVLKGDDGLERLMCYHASDPLYSEEHAHDAFSAWLILEHGDDLKAAVKEAAEGLGMSYSREPNITFGSSSAAVASEPAEPEEPWEDPLKLPATAPEVPTLPAEMIPEPLRPWIDDVATRLCVHREYIAVPALVSLGAVVGRTVGIHPKQYDDWLEVANLWGALVGPPSSKKSPAIAEASAPLERLAALAAEAHANAQAEHEADAEIIKLELEAIKKRARASNADPADFRDELQTKLSALEENNVPERRYLTNDGTIEKIAELLKATPRGLLVKRDELIGLLRTCDKSGHETDRAFYLEAWNGKGRHTIDRVGKGTFHIPALTLAVLGGIQPGPLSTYVRGAIEGEGGADGLLQRFQLLVWPDRQRPYVNIDRYADTAAKNRAFQLFEFLDLKTGEELGAKKDELNPDSIPALRFSPQAQVLFNDWLESLMKRLLSPELEATPAFHAHLSKYPSLMPSLALVFHLIDVADGRASGPVSADAADLAAAWCDFLELHARKLYALELNHDAASAHALAERIIQGEVQDTQNVSDLYRRRFPGLVTAAEVSAALGTLEACHWLQVEELPNPGARPTKRIRLNPQITGG